MAALKQKTLQLRALQQLFFGHLVGEKTDVAEHVQSTPDRSADQRIHIYATGYRLRLKEAISTDFDKLYSYLGDGLFEQLMDDYIDTYQSHHPSLRYYSKNMGELLRAKEPFSNYPELLELAQIEQAFNNSFDAADCVTMNIDDLAQIAPETWANLSIQFHASMALLPLQKNTFAIWKALSEEQHPPEAISENSVWMIWRKDLISRYREVSEAENHILSLAVQGENFTQLCKVMTAYCDEDQAPVQVIGLLQNWINEKIVCQLM